MSSNNKNSKLITLFFVLLIITFIYFTHTIRLCVITEIDSKREFIITKCPLSTEDIDLARQSLHLIGEIDPSQRYDGFENVDLHWMNSKKYVGMTVYKSDGVNVILLDYSLKIKNKDNPWEYVKLGAIYSHELSHAINGTKDPYTETITDAKLWGMIRGDKILTESINNWKPGKILTVEH